MSLVLLLANIALVLALSVFVLSTIKLRSLPAYLLAIYVVAYADIVLILEFAGLISELNRHMVLALQLALTAGSIVLWIRGGRPPLRWKFANLAPGNPARDTRPPLRVLLLGLVALLVGYVYLSHARLILALPPENYDALTYHLSRVGYWLQYHSLYPWPTPNPRQTTFPMNAELGVLWTILWYGTDRLSGFVQWIAVPAIMLGTYGLTRLLGYSRWQSALTALLWATLTQVLFQSSTTQNDLVTTSFWVATLYFLFAGLRGGKGAFILLSGLAFGLAVGSKSTSLVVLPGLGVAMLAVWLISRQQKDVRRHLVGWTAACLVGFSLFGSYIYVQNTHSFGDPLGPPTPRTGSSVFQPEGGLETSVSRLRDNLARYAYQFVDFSGLPIHLPTSINPVKAAVFSRIYQWLGVSVENPQTIGYSGFSLDYINPLDENGSWFGPLAALLIPVVILQAYLGARRQDPLRLALPAIGAGFLVLISATQAWTPAKGRYFMIPVALCFPLMACLLQTRTVWRGALASCILVLGLTSMWTITLNDESLQHVGWRDAFAAVRRDPSWANEYSYRLIMENVPATSSIGLVTGDDYRDYPFFGEHFTRRVALAIPVLASSLPSGGAAPFQADFQHSDYIFVTGGQVPSIPAAVLGAFDLLSDDGANSLWARKGLRSSSTCDTDKWPFSDFYGSPANATVCPQFPIYPGLTAGGNARTIFLRDGHFVPVVAAGREGKFGFGLLVQHSGAFTFSVQVVPQRSGVSQVFQILFASTMAEPQLHSASFSEARVLHFGVPLEPGTYAVQLGLADGSTEARVRTIEIAAP